MAREVKIAIVLDARGAIKGIRGLDGEVVDLKGSLNKASQATTSFQRITETAFGVGLRDVFQSAVRWAKRLGRAYVDLILRASDLNETQSKFNTVFGESTERMTAFVEEFATLAGASKAEAKDFLSSTAALLQGAGFLEKASADAAEQVFRLGADLQSFNNIPIEQTIGAINAALTGERERLKALNITLLETDVQQRALLRSKKETVEALTQEEKAYATLELIQERAGRAVGDVARTSSDAANQFRQFAAEVRNLRDDLSRELQPAAARTASVLNEQINNPAIKQGLITLAKFVGLVTIGFLDLGRRLQEFLARQAVFLAIWLGRWADLLQRVAVGLDILGLDSVAGKLNDMRAALLPTIQGLTEFGAKTLANVDALKEDTEAKTKNTVATNNNAVAAAQAAREAAERERAEMERKKRLKEAIDAVAMARRRNAEAMRLEAMQDELIDPFAILEEVDATIRALEREERARNKVTKAAAKQAELVGQSETANVLAARNTTEALKSTARQQINAILAKTIAKAIEPLGPAALIVGPLIAAGIKLLFDRVLPKFAAGGMVSGPGTSTSDSVPILASRGEFVVNAQAASANRSLLENINAGGEAGGGGLVPELRVDMDELVIALRRKEDLDRTLRGI